MPCNVQKSILAKFVVAFVTISALGGCGGVPWYGRVIESSVDELDGSFEESGKAIVIASCNVTRETIWNKASDLRSFLVFHKKVPTTITRRGKEYVAYFFVVDSDDPEVYAIEPGAYALQKVGHKAKRPSDLLIPNGWNRETGKPHIGEFVVRPGEVVNLGHFYGHLFEDGPYEMEVQVINRLDEAREALVDEFEDDAGPILDKLETRLLSLRKRI